MKADHRFLKITTILCMIFMLCFSSVSKIYAEEGYAWILLNSRQETMKIGDEFCLSAVSTDGRRVRFSSSDPKVASVNVYGVIRAKKAGTADIKAKTKNGEAVCRITVQPTEIRLNRTYIIMENGTNLKLLAQVSTGHAARFRSKKRSVATVDEEGNITACKPGETVITVSADGTSVTCTVVVKEPKVVLSRSRVILYRKGECTLSVSSTSKSLPRWKSSRSGVASVDSNGKVTALKHGMATITVTVDGVKKTCDIIVKQPVITVEPQKLNLKKGKKKRLSVKVSSGNIPYYSSSNTSVATVSQSGVVKAVGTGTAYIYASEDGVKGKVSVTVK